MIAGLQRAPRSPRLTAPEGWLGRPLITRPWSSPARSTFPLARLHPPPLPPLQTHRRDHLSRSGRRRRRRSTRRLPVVGIGDRAHRAGLRPAWPSDPAPGRSAVLIDVHAGLRPQIGTASPSRSAPRSCWWPPMPYDSAASQSQARFDASPRSTRAQALRWCRSR